MFWVSVYQLSVFMWGLLWWLVCVLVGYVSCAGYKFQEEVIRSFEGIREGCPPLRPLCEVSRWRVSCFLLVVCVECISADEVGDCRLLCTVSIDGTYYSLLVKFSCGDSADLYAVFGSLLFHVLWDICMGADHLSNERPPFGYNVLLL